MTDLYVCMGSACYVKGSQQIVERLQYHIAHKKLDLEIVLKGSFCLGPCIQGVVVKVGNRQFKNLNGFNIDERFEQEILPYIIEINGGGNSE